MEGNGNIKISNVCGRFLLSREALLETTSEMTDERVHEGKCKLVVLYVCVYVCLFVSMMSMRFV